MKLYLVAISLLLAGCSTSVPVKRTFPEAPQSIRQKCENLKTVEIKERIPITDVLKVVVHNYTLYHECSLKVEGWNEWYESQKKIFNDVK